MDLPFALARFFFRLRVLIRACAFWFALTRFAFALARFAFALARFAFALALAFAIAVTLSATVQRTRLPKLH